MCQYIDLTKLIIGVPEHVELNPSNHCEHPDIKVELPICLGEEELVESQEYLVKRRWDKIFRDEIENHVIQ